MSTISLCMIVKNEEKHLKNCLESVQGLVDEIIIVDTGSDDNTVQIAKEFDANVFHFDWIDDFSAARNFALEKATKEWVLSLDGDEAIQNIDPNTIRELLNSKRNIAFEMEIRNLSQNNKTPFVHKSVRLFKNNVGITYKNKIHEQVSIGSNPIPYYELATLPVIINHIGYSDEISQEKNKQQRNFDILKSELEANPNNRFLHFNIANEYLKTEDYITALYHYKLATSNKRDTEMLSHAILKMIIALYELKRMNEMFELIEEGKQKFPEYTDIYYFHADILEKLGREEEAKYLYEVCLRKGNPKKSYVTRHGVGDALPLRKLTDLYLKHGYHKKAAETLLKLISLNKYDEKVVNNLLKLYKLHFGDKEIDLVLKELFPIDNEEDARFVMKLSYETRNKNIFIETYNYMMGNFPNSIDPAYVFYYYLAVDENEICKEILASEKYENELHMIQYYLHTNDSYFISETNNENVRKIVEFNQTKKRNKAFELTEETYYSLIDELLRINKGEDLHTFSELYVLYNPIFSAVLGNLYYSYFQYEYAAKCYQTYLKEVPNDFMVTLILAELSLIMGYEADAVKHAHSALKLNKEHYRSFEIILESYKELGNKEQCKSLAQEISKFFPYDNYLRKF